MREVEIGGHIVRVGLLVAPEGDVLSVSVRSRSAPHVVLDSAFLRTEGVPHAAAAELEAGVAYVADGNPLVNAARALLDAPLLGAFLAPAAPPLKRSRRYPLQRRLLAARRRPALDQGATLCDNGVDRSSCRK